MQHVSARLLREALAHDLHLVDGQGDAQAWQGLQVLEGAARLEGAVDDCRTSLRTTLEVKHKGYEAMPTVIAEEYVDMYIDYDIRLL